MRPASRMTVQNGVHFQTWEKMAEPRASQRELSQDGPSTPNRIHSALLTNPHSPFSIQWMEMKVGNAGTAQGSTKIISNALFHQPGRQKNHRIDDGVQVDRVREHLGIQRCVATHPQPVHGRVNHECTKHSDIGHNKGYRPSELRALQATAPIAPQRLPPDCRAAKLDSRYGGHDRLLSLLDWVFGEDLFGPFERLV